MDNIGVYIVISSFILSVPVWIIGLGVASIAQAANKHSK
jgi:hypothetical protein